MARMVIRVTPPVPIEIGEIDMDAVRKMGQAVTLHGRRAWACRAIPLDSGSLVWIPSIAPDEL